MRVIDGVIGGLWLVFWLYWLVSAAGVKAGRSRSRQALAIRAIIGAGVVVLVRFGVVRDKVTVHSRPLQIIGLVVVVLGLALAVWARVYLGRNWGMPMTRKDDPELVNRGPYRHVRHPIYTGILLGVLGTALAVSPVVLALLALLAVYFAYSARVEERYLGERFPDSYPPYRRATKMLVPFVF